MTRQLRADYREKSVFMPLQLSALSGKEAVKWRAWLALVNFFVILRKFTSLSFLQESVGNWGRRQGNSKVFHQITTRIFLEDKKNIWKIALPLNRKIAEEKFIMDRAPAFSCAKKFCFKGKTFRRARFCSDIVRAEMSLLWEKVSSILIAKFLVGN